MNRIFYFLIVLFFVTYYKAQNIYAYAGTGIYGHSGDGGPAIMANIGCARYIAFDKLGNLHIADESHGVIRKVDALGIISTIAGTSVSGYSGDGGPATLAQLDSPHGIAVDNAGNIYVSELFGHRIRKINSLGIINTIAGSGTAGFSGDGGPANVATINSPRDIAIDDTGNVYFSDFNNNRIRKINTSGIISTIAGNNFGGNSGDGGPANLATLHGPGGIYIDKLNNIYFSDCLNYSIRKINISGIITTVAGNGIAGFSGNGGLATASSLRSPVDVTMDSIGNMYITETIYMHSIRKVDNLGVITTIAGTGAQGNAGNGGPAILAQFNYPDGLAVYDGNLYIAECASIIRKICNNTCITVVSDSEKDKINISPNPTNGVLIINSHYVIQKIDVSNITGQILLRETVSNKSHQLQLQNFAEGFYFVKVIYENGLSFTRKIIVSR